MKTAISVPDSIYERVERRAAELGLNRSEFYTFAADRYLRELDDQDVTDRLNAAIARSGDPEQREARAVAAASMAQMAAILKDDEW